jgi:hypothetical protein
MQLGLHDIRGDFETIGTLLRQRHLDVDRRRYDTRYMFQGFGFKVQGSGFKVQGSRFRVAGFKFDEFVKREFLLFTKPSSFKSQFKKL